MRRGRVLLILVFVILFIVVALLVVWRLVPGLGQQTTTVTVTPDVETVAFLKATVSKGDRLNKEEHLEFREWPRGKASEDMFLETAIDEVIDEDPIFAMDLAPGTPLMRNMLLGKDEIISLDGSIWSRSIPRGSVAVSIPISRLSSVSYAPRPGDHVNVISTMMFVDLDTEFQSITPSYTGMVIASGPPDPETGERDPLTVSVASLLPRDLPDPGTGQMGFPASQVPGVYGRVVIDPVLGQAVYLVPSEQQRPRLVSHMMLQDIMVLQIGTFPLEGEAEAAAAAAAAQQAQGEEQQAPTVVKPDIVTLIVTPQDAVTLNYLIYAGAEITLALRFPQDDIRIDTSPVTLQFLLEQYRLPIPVRLPYGLNPRRDNLSAPVLQNDIPQQ
ncbi:RcpC/CpaB family pilus assembly protein [Chloroflexota bacterium]